METMYTRAYSANSPRRLASGKGPAGNPLTSGEPPHLMDHNLLNEFRNHINPYSVEPTALVSVSNRIIDTLNRALCLHLVKGEHPSDIWIAFIVVRAATSASSVTVHPAQPLAAKVYHRDPPALKYESVFEWAIPEECVRHRVRLQTLIDRGLRCRDFLGHELEYVNTFEMRKNIASVLDSTCLKYGSWDIGLYLGYFARTFGARAPSFWIAHQLFNDCVSAKIIPGDTAIIRDVQGCSACVDFEYFTELDEGIDTALIDWWLAGYDFSLEYKEFVLWRVEQKEFMAWDLIDFCETWNNGFQTDERGLHDEAESALSARHDECRNDIEARAVELGL